MTTVKDVMTTTPMGCAIDDSARAAARIMWQRDCGIVPVLSPDGHVVGVVTDRDLCIATYFHDAALSAIPVANVMSRAVCTCRPEDDLIHAEHVMRDHQVHRLPVVDAEDRLVGLLSLGDVLSEIRRIGVRKANGDCRELIETLTVIHEPRTEGYLRRKGAAPA